MRYTRNRSQNHWQERSRNKNKLKYYSQTRPTFKYCTLLNLIQYVIYFRDKVPKIIPSSNEKAWFSWIKEDQSVNWCASNISNYIFLSKILFFNSMLLYNDLFSLESLYTIKTIDLLGPNFVQFIFLLNYWCEQILIIKYFKLNFSRKKLYFS